MPFSCRPGLHLALLSILLLCPFSASAILPDEEPAPPKAVQNKPVSKPKPREDTNSKKAENQTSNRAAGKSFRDCGDCPEMVRIPGGSFMMGASSGEDGSQDDEGPLHMVRVDGFAIGKYEVTRAQFAAFVDDTGYESSGCYTWNGSKWEEDSSASWRRPGFSQGGDHPVVCVSFEDAEAYTRWLNRKTGKTFRLPTESEWEYAARAGTDAARYWGEDGDDACRYANVGDRTAKQTLQNRTVHDCSDGYVYTAPVGSFKPNRFGLYDVLGNVWEWTCSSYTERYDGSETEYGSSGRRVVRDGSWFDAPEDVRSANRGWSGPTLLFNNLGFRLAHD